MKRIRILLLLAVTLTLTALGQGTKGPTTANAAQQSPTIASTVDREISDVEQGWERP